MTEARGKPLGAIILMVTLWVSARAGQHQFEANDTITVSRNANAMTPTPQGSRTPADEIWRHAQFPEVNIDRNRFRAAQQRFWTSDNQTKHNVLGVQKMAGAGLVDLPRDVQHDAPMTKQLLAGETERRPAFVAPFGAGPTEYVMPSKRVDVYAYSFWRSGTAPNGLAPGSQYGGSQSGFIATYRLSDNNDAVALLWRAAFVPGDRSQREFAVGARWRPLRKIPLSLSAEHRFRRGGNSSLAVYVAGGKNDVALPAKFKLDGFAQAGILADQKVGWFFDGALHADRPVLKSTAATISIGGGIWAGGQRDAARLDVGPAVQADFRAANMQFRVNADWRFRIAGGARPGNGPALTVSTSF